MEKVIQYLDQNQVKHLKELEDYLRIPSISTDSERAGDVRKAAHFTRDLLSNAGLQRVEVIKTGGHPIVYGERIENESLATLLVYGHYDVQPVDPLELWTTGPFEPSIRDGRIFARGAADDKGQLMVHIKSAEAFVETRGRLPVNLKFLIEGEEEVGSTHLDEFIEAHRDLLKTDAVVISDTTMFAPGVPSICYGLRGLAYMEIEVTGPRQDLHSGSFGGPVANPACVLAEIIASMKDGKGRVTIPHFYDDVLEVAPWERDQFAALPFDKASYAQELGVKELDGEEGFSPLEQLWVRPSLDVNGLLSGFTGQGAKTVLPSKALAKVSMRLVPNQVPARIERLFTDFVVARAPRSVEVTVRALHGGQPWLASIDHPALAAAARALEKGFDAKPIFQREGGSIPVVATFTEVLGVPSVLIGLGLPDENAHAPDENLSLTNFYKGIRSSAYLLEEFGRRQVN